MCMEKAMDILRHNIKWLRKEKDITQEKLAEKAGMSAHEVGKIERKKINPSLEVVERLASGLGKKIHELLNPELDLSRPCPPASCLRDCVKEEVGKLSEPELEFLHNCIRGLKKLNQKQNPSDTKLYIKD